jgi:hypothetical protein
VLLIGNLLSFGDRKAQFTLLRGNFSLPLRFNQQHLVTLVELRCRFAYLRELQMDDLPSLGLFVVVGISLCLCLLVLVMLLKLAAFTLGI